MDEKEAVVLERRNPLQGSERVEEKNLQKMAPLPVRDGRSRTPLFAFKKGQGRSPETDSERNQKNPTKKHEKKKPPPHPPAPPPLPPPPQPQQKKRIEKEGKDSS